MDLRQRMGCGVSTVRGTDVDPNGLGAEGPCWRGRFGLVMWVWAQAW